VRAGKYEGLARVPFTLASHAREAPQRLLRGGVEFGFICDLLHRQPDCFAKSFMKRTRVSTELSSTAL